MRVSVTLEHTQEVTVTLDLPEDFSLPPGSEQMGPLTELALRELDAGRAYWETTDAITTWEEEGTK